MRLSTTFLCSALALAACAPASAGRSAGSGAHGVGVQPGVAYRVEVDNPTGCPARVTLDVTEHDRRPLGTVVAGTRQVFEVRSERPAAVSAIALEEDGRMCGGTLTNRTRVRILDPAA